MTHVNDIFENIGLKPLEETVPSPMKLDVTEEKIIELLKRNGKRILRKYLTMLI